MDFSGEGSGITDVNGEQRFLLYDLGASTNIQSDDNLDGDDDDLLDVQAKITAITGEGQSSSLAFQPINISANPTNNAAVDLTGMVIEYVDNLLLDEFPSTNVSPD